MVITSDMQSVACISFVRSLEDLSQYRVTKKQGKEIPEFLSEFDNESFRGADGLAKGKEGILLDYDLMSDGKNYEWSFYTTNKDAIVAKRMENPDQEITRVRICGFILKHNQAYVDWNNYRLMITFQNAWGKRNWEWLFISFFEKPSRRF